MAGAGFMAVKKRIKSVQNTKKITKAMAMVATSKLRKCKEKLYINRQYYESMEILLKNIYNNYEGENKFIVGNGSNKKLYIAITSDLGLCGGFNINVINNLKSNLPKERKDSELIIIGQKGRSILKKLNLDTLSEYVDVGNLPTIKDASIVVQQCVDMYNKDEVGEVFVVYTEFVSTVKRVVHVEKILPLSLEKEVFDDTYVEYDNEVDNIVNEILPMYISEKFLYFMLNSRTSEESTRMEAMNGATKNANDLLDKLHLKYNRIRQSAITQEISEIVGGAEAQK